MTDLEKGSTSLLTSHSVFVFIIIIIIVTRDRETFLHTIGVQPGLIDPEVCRATLFEDVLKMYDTQMSTLMLEYPFHINNELGVDGGGLARDMISAFWEEAYSKMFDGALVVVPSMHPEPPFANFALPQLVVSFPTHFWLVVFCQYA